MGADNMGTGLSRRELLKKSAVAGGLVWAAPMVLASPASAAHCPTGSCPVYYAVKVDPNPSNGQYGPFNCTNTRIGNMTSGCTGLLDPPDGAVAGSKSKCQALTDAVDTANTLDPGRPSGQTSDGGPLTLVLKPGYSFFFAIRKKGSATGNGGVPCTGTQGSTHEPSSDCRTVVFGTGASHIEFAFCAPS